MATSTEINDFRELLRLKYARSNKQKILKIIKNASVELLNDPDISNRTFLIYALEVKNLEVVQELLKAGARANVDLGQKGFPIVYGVSYWAKDGDRRFYDLLVKYGAIWGQRQFDFIKGKMPSEIIKLGQELLTKRNMGLFGKFFK